MKLSDDVCVHHVNHIRSDNRPENLVALTASEHAKEHALEDGKHVGQRYCIDCGKAIGKGATRCVACYGIHQRTKNYPTKEKLSELIQTMSNCAIGRLYDVSDSSVRKWRKKYGLPPASTQRVS